MKNENNTDNVEDQDLSKGETDPFYDSEAISKSKNNSSVSNIQDVISTASQINNQIGKAVNNIYQVYVPAYKKLSSQFQSIHINPALITAAKTLVNAYEKIVNIKQPPIIQWLQTIDFSSFYQAIQGLEDHVNTGKLKNILLWNFYNIHWFPGLLLNADRVLMENIIETIAHTKLENRETRKIDKVIFDYYTEKRIENIRKSWRELNLPGYLIRLMREGVQAYYKKQYGVTVIILSSLWERIIYDKAGDDDRRIGKRSKENFRVLVEKNNYPEILSSYYDEFIMYDCECAEDTKPDSPGRNSAAHGFFSQYPTRKAALNAILFTDILVRLQPLQEQ